MNGNIPLNAVVEDIVSGSHADFALWLNYSVRTPIRG
jgi:hypothetical protein